MEYCIDLILNFIYLYFFFLVKSIYSSFILLFNLRLLMTTLKKNFWSCHVGTQVRTEAHEHPFFGRSCVNIPYLVYRTLKRVVLSLGHYGMPRGGKWAGWVINGLDNKWVGCIIIHLSIYDPFIYKLIIHYQPNPFN